MLGQKHFIIILIRLFLGYVFLSSGLCKLTHGLFGQVMGPPLLETALAKYGLGLFACIVAVSQVVGGSLLLSQRFSTVGAVVLLPMNLAIMAVTISMQWVGTPYVNAFFILLNISLLIYDWPKLKIIINPAFATSVRPTLLDTYHHKIYFAGLAFALAALLSSRSNILLTNVFAITFFLMVGFGLFQGKVLSSLQSAVVVLVITNMLIITITAFLHLKGQRFVMYNSMLILVLLAGTFIKSPKKRKQFALS